MGGRGGKVVPAKKRRAEPKRFRFTLESVDRLKPRESDYLVWDVEPKKLALRVYPSGQKVYMVRLYRNGVQRWHRIGRHGEDAAPVTRADAERDRSPRLTPEEARKRAWFLLGLVAGGEDPAAAREAAKGIPTLSAFAVRYLDEYAVLHKKPASVEADRGLLGLRESRRKHGYDEQPKTSKKHRTILAALGRMKVDAVTRADVTRLHVEWGRSTPIRANRALALLSHMFAMAEAWGLRPQGTNPCHGVERFRENKRKRYLSQSELAQLGKALKGAEKTEDPFAVAAIRLLVFTGARLSEIVTAQWDYLDRERGVLMLPDSKTGHRDIVLSAPALAVLQGLRRVAGNPYIIAGRKKGTHFAGIEKVWQRIREAAKLEDVRIHDLRHSFASVAVAGNATLPLIGGLLGHSSPATTARYAHLSADPLRDVAEAVGNRLTAAMNGERSDPSKVKAARRRRA